MLIWYEIHFMLVLPNFQLEFWMKSIAFWGDLLFKSFWNFYRWPLIRHCPITGPLVRNLSYLTARSSSGSFKRWLAQSMRHNSQHHHLSRNFYYYFVLSETKRDTTTMEIKVRTPKEQMHKKQYGFFWDITNFFVCLEKYVCSPIITQLMHKSHSK